MKFYDTIIPLGQYCVTSTALSRCHLRKETLPFDWSAGILPEAGRLGLEVKVKLIANDFQDFFNFEYFENRGNNQENDVQNLWIVNKRTGLQYKHDFSSASPFEAQFEAVKEKYMRRVKRLYEKIEKAITSNANSDDYVDVVEKVKNGETGSKHSSASDTIVTVVILLVAVFGIAALIKTSKEK